MHRTQKHLRPLELTCRVTYAPVLGCRKQASRRSPICHQEEPDKSSVDGQVKPTPLWASGPTGSWPTGQSTFLYCNTSIGCPRCHNLGLSLSRWLRDGERVSTRAVVAMRSQRCVLARLLGCTQPQGSRVRVSGAARGRDGARTCSLPESSAAAALRGRTLSLREAKALCPQSQREPVSVPRSVTPSLCSGLHAIHNSGGQRRREPPETSALGPVPL